MKVTDVIMLVCGLVLFLVGAVAAPVLHSRRGPSKRTRVLLGIATAFVGMLLMLVAIT